MGGIEKQVLFLAQHLPEQGVSVAVACPPGGPLIDQLRKAGATLYPVRMAGKFDISSAIEVARILRSGKFDLIHTHQERTLWFAMTAKSLAQVKVPIIQTEHNRTIDRMLTPRKVREMRSSTLRVHRMLSKYVAGFIAVSVAVKQFLIKYEGIPAKKIEVIPIAIDLSAFGDQTHSRDEIRRSLNLPLGSPVIANLSKLSPQKDHKTFLKAAKEVLSRVPDAHFLVIGQGEERSQLESLVSELEINRQVHLLGWVPNAAEVLAAADVFVLSSLWEGLPAAPIEAMAMGLPVVATAVSGTPELVTHGETGFLCSPSNPLSMADFICQLISDKNLRISMGRLGRKHAHESFSPQLFSKLTENYYERVLSQSRLIGN
jgi:glycosyltransferase involved in cell wall biosynthesis